MRGKKCVDESGFPQTGLPYVPHRSASVAAALRRKQGVAAERTDHHHIELKATLQKFVFDLPSDS